MRLLLLRHAKAEKAEAGASDLARRLTARGRSDTALIGAYVARHELIPDAAIVSTARRTRETWECLAAAFPRMPPVTFEERLYNAGTDAILAVVKATAPSVRSLLIIGHNP